MNDKVNGGKVFAGSPGEYFPHQPVLYQEVLNALAPQSGKTYLDGTLGAGGHAEGILKASAPEGRLLGLDLDPKALAIARQRLLPFEGRVVIQQASYLAADEVVQLLGWPHVNGILLDLGVSSMQIDQPERGFSFMMDGPLDMRFDQEMGTSAADLVNNLSEEELAQIIWTYGEERYARRIAKGIVAARPINSTLRLVKAIKDVVPGYGSRIHPATRTFQALRIATNKELDSLSSALPKLVRCLAIGGKIAIISFHSLEDRIVKQFFKQESQDCICPPEQPICTCKHSATVRVLTKKPIRATKSEIATNPRSSSAKLRVAEKISEA
jgi:16S rRNA (cytosine1402-N4)-methyltransferase